ncbi:site-specific integrase [Streptomyces sp. CB02959]|uniref:tyrosine-type recombinase/integrase n=1 Tax=Streptomyces sp. CB02959 TaxID=2020330 RepID=UPI000C27899D|nr:site-specific integrase [Streptomyces sp. CB02959]PJN38953.1 site-specific integrase [Streptomyces sp. CB02959]
MATIRERTRKDGSSIFQVRWVQGGRGGTNETESFAEPEQADQFRKLVDAHGQEWPPGWIKGRGFVEPDTDPDDIPFVDWATRYVDRLTGIDERTREDYHRDIRIHLSLLQHTTRAGVVTPATICNLTADDIQDWVRAEEKGAPDEGDAEKWARRPADPKSIANRHGLLWCIVQAAVEAEPQLRTTNCCKGTSLPRVDDHTEEEMCFLEHDEYARIAAEIKDPAARDLADWLVSTGMRWGEATALQVRDLALTADRPTVSVQRAWKKAKKGSEAAFYLGPPKTRKARRVLALSPAQVEMARRLVVGQPPAGFVFRAAMGGAWRHANFYNRKWMPAVKSAVEKGLPKRPRIHDLRHTHVSWLIGANIPLPAIQNRLGHESIQTTVDRYGHLVRSLDGEIVAAVEAALSGPAIPAQGRLRSVV